MQIHAENDVLAMAVRCKFAHGEDVYGNRIGRLSRKAQLVLRMFEDRNEPDDMIRVLAWWYHDVRPDQLTEEDTRAAEVELIEIIREIRHTLDC